MAVDVRTSDAANGQPSDIRIDTAGSVTVTSGAAVIIDSNNDVTNGGKISISNANDASGIMVTGPRIADIVNVGTITIDETYTPTDTDNDGDLDGLFAIGQGRTAIKIDCALTGNINHSGAILVEGNQSVGVAVVDVSGNVRLAGEIYVKGVGSLGAVLSGNLSGALRVQSAITATSYRTVPAPSDTSRLDADDLLQGGRPPRI